MRRAPNIRTLLTLIAAILVSTFVPSTTAPPTRAAQSTAGVPTTCVPNVIDQFRALKHHGEALGFRLTGGVPDPTLFRHFQGIQRLEGAGTPYFFVSRSGNETTPDPDIFGDDPGDIFVVKFDSRDQSGERLRSNRMKIGQDTDDTPPPLEDRVVHHIQFSGTERNGITWPSYRHPGGMQTFQDVLIVPLEAPEHKTTQSPTRLVMIELRNPNDPTVTPENPRKLHEFALEQTHAGVVAITRRDDNNRLLLVVSGEKNETLHIYEANSGDLRDPNLALTQIDTWSHTELESDEGWHTGTAAHQSYFLAKDCGGALYMLGTRNTTGGHTFPFSEDWADLYEVTFDAQGQFKLHLVSERHFFCDYEGPEMICDFAASGGFYVSPTGELILYATEHEDTGPDVEVGDIDDDTVRMAEFRSGLGFRTGSPNLLPTLQHGGPYTVPEGQTKPLNAVVAPPYAEAWAELYDDKDFRDRSIVFDWADRDRDSFGNLAGHDGFSDKTSSVRWLAPIGCNVILHKDPANTGDGLILHGTGRLESIADLEDEINPNTNQRYDFGDEADSVMFSGATCNGDQVRVVWNLDGKPGYEVDQAPYSFNASAIDGPATATAFVRACGAFNGCAEQGGAIITIVNVAPTFANTWITTPIDEGGNVTLSGTFRDPGIGDTHKLTVTWGDGTSETIAFPLGEREFSVKHAYPDDNPTGTPEDRYPIRAVIADDDGGSSSYDLVATVRNVAPAVRIDTIADETGAAIGVDTPAALLGLPVRLAGRFSDPGQRDTHTLTIDWGDGKQSLGATSGAHTYTATGRFLVRLTVTDDDGGTSHDERWVEVRDAAGMTQATLDRLKELASMPGLPTATRNALEDAIAKLQGNNGGEGNGGALDLFAAGDVNAAVEKLEQALGALATARTTSPTLDLTTPQRSLTLAAKAAALQTIAKAAAVAATPQAQDKVAQAKAIVVEGDALLAAGNYVGAATKYGDAIAKALEALPKK